MFRVRSRFDPDTTAQRLREAVEREGLWVLAHIDGAANASRQGIQTAAHQIMEVFHPAYAARVWAAKAEAGLSIPVRLHIYEAEDGAVYVDCQRPSALLAPHGLAALDAVGEELDPRFERICQAGGGA